MADPTPPPPLPTLTDAEWRFADDQRRREATAFGVLDLDARRLAREQAERRLLADAECRAVQERTAAAVQVQAAAQALMAKNLLIPTPMATVTRRAEYMEFLLAFAPGRTAAQAKAEADAAYAAFRADYPASVSF